MSSQWIHDGKEEKIIVIWPSPKVRKWPTISKSSRTFQNKRPLPIWLPKSALSVSQRGNCWYKKAKGYDKIYRRAERSGNAEEWIRAKTIDELQLSLWSALLTAGKISKGPTPEQFSSTFNRYRCGKGIRKGIGGIRSEMHLPEKLSLPHHPVLNSINPGRLRRVCNAASKLDEVCLHDKLLAGADLLHELIETIFRLRKGPIALTVDIESMFPNMHLPKQSRNPWSQSAKRSK